ncbi:hypothetical protein U1Q18_052691 [Sarracenia purpurea var. burkii]
MKRECPQRLAMECFRCGQQGHLKWDCPQLQTVQGAQNVQRGQQVQGRQGAAQPQQQMRGQVTRGGGGNSSAQPGRPPAGGNQPRVYALGGLGLAPGTPGALALPAAPVAADSTVGPSVIRGDPGKTIFEE